MDQKDQQNADVMGRIAHKILQRSQVRMHV